MVNHTSSNLRHTLPVWQSRVLLGAGLAALAAAALGSGVYAFQSASASQEVYGIPTDALIKTTLAVAADIGVALGAAVTAFLFLSGRKGLKRQAWVAAAATALAFCIGTANLSGYFAWTRAQHGVDAVIEDPLYRVAVANAERAVDDPRFHLNGTDRRLLEAARTPDTAERDFGDVLRAIGLHILVLLFGSAYRLPTRKAAKSKRSTRRPAKGSTPKLVASNG